MCNCICFISRTVLYSFELASSQCMVMLWIRVSVIQCMYKKGMKYENIYVQRRKWKVIKTFLYVNYMLAVALCMYSTHTAHNYDDDDVEYRSQSHQQYQRNRRMTCSTLYFAILILNTLDFWSADLTTCCSHSIPPFLSPHCVRLHKKKSLKWNVQVVWSSKQDLMLNDRD